MAAETLLSLGSSFWDARWEEEDEIPRLKSVSFIHREEGYYSHVFRSCSRSESSGPQLRKHPGDFSLAKQGQLKHTGLSLQSGLCSKV
jgi:hypothetical protein